jgi:hypothetical protein
LGLADEEDAFNAVKPSEVLMGHVVLPLPLLERHQVEPLGLDEALDGRHERLTDGRDQHRRGYSRAQLRLHEVREPCARLERRDIGVQIHPVDGFQFEGHVMVEDLSDVLAYHGGGAPGERGPSGHRPDRVYHVGAGCKPCLAPGAPLFFTNEAPPQTGLQPPFLTHARRSEAEPR